MPTNFVKALTKFVYFESWYARTRFILPVGVVAHAWHCLIAPLIFLVGVLAPHLQQRRIAALDNRVRVVARTAGVVVEAPCAEPPGAGSACELGVAAPACSAPTCTAPPLGHPEVGETAGSLAGPLNTVPKKRFVVLYSSPLATKSRCKKHRSDFHRCAHAGS